MVCAPKGAAPLKIAPSILASDFAALGADCRRMQDAGADMLHVDVMDGCFVPNISIGVPVVECLRRSVWLPLDVHLMILHPQQYVEAFARAGANTITFHLEAPCEPREVLAKIRESGCRAGIVLKPATPAAAAFPLLPLVDVVMVMTVEPGFGGQRFMEGMLPKISALRQKADALGLPALDIEVDGGIDADTAPLVCGAGANVLVAGSALFGKPDYAAAMAALRGA